MSKSGRYHDRTRQSRGESEEWGERMYPASKMKPKISVNSLFKKQQKGSERRVLTGSCVWTSNWRHFLRKNDVIAVYWPWRTAPQASSRMKKENCACKLLCRAEFVKHLRAACFFKHLITRVARMFRAPCICNSDFTADLPSKAQSTSNWKGKRNTTSCGVTNDLITRSSFAVFF